MVNIEAVKNKKNNGVHICTTYSTITTVSSKAGGFFFFKKVIGNFPFFFPFCAPNYELKAINQIRSAYISPQTFLTFLTRKIPRTYVK